MLLHRLTLDNATNFTTGVAAAAFTSTTLVPQVVNERHMLDEEERELRQSLHELTTVMFDEMMKPSKLKERQKSKAYATIMTNFGGLNVELHGDRAPKTVYNFVQLAKQGYYDNVAFHRLMPGFMVSCWLSSLTLRYKEATRQGLVVEGRVSGASHSGTSTESLERSSTTAEE